MPTGYSKKTGQNPFKGKKRPAFSDEHKKKIGLAQIGRKPWNKGKKGLQKMSLETRKKMSLKRKNEKHPAWKGNKAGYQAIHSWIRRNLSPAKFFKCHFCECEEEIRKLNWANLDHKYKRLLSDWIVLCVRCHHNYDQFVLGVKFGRTKK